MKLKPFIAAAIIVLAASCSTEQPTPIVEVEEENKSVTLNANFDEQFATRADAAEPSDYQMRYILEIRATETKNVVSRIEQTTETFTFLLEQGTYDFLLWADYIPKDATATNGKYADMYYNTTDLNAVARTATAVADYTALDAFATVVTQEKKAAALTMDGIKLTRPLARINLIEKMPELFKDVTKITIATTPEANQVFDVQTENLGTTTASAAITHTITAPTDENFFFDYIFAPTTKAMTVNPMTVKIYMGEEVANEFIIPKDIPYQRNSKTNISASYTTNSGTAIELAEWDEDGFDVDVDEYIAITWDGTKFTDADAAKAALGDPAEPNVYEIRTAAQLAAIAYIVDNKIGTYNGSNITYKLMANLDLQYHAWTPIGESWFFQATFNGNGHKISGLNVRAEDNFMYAGLFGASMGSIQYLMVEGDVASDRSSARVGGIVGRSVRTMSFCSFEGTLAVDATNEYVGGLAGSFEIGTISNCISMLKSETLTELGNDYPFGILAGRNNGGTITNSAWTAVGDYGAVGFGNAAANSGVLDLSDLSQVNTATGNEYIWKSDGAKPILVKK